MASKVAIASGNWNNPAIWEDGVVPTTGDDVWANNYTININQNVTVNSLLNTSVPWILPYTATATMTDFAAPSGVVSASSTTSTNYSWKAFNKNTGDYWQSGTNNTGWIKYQFPTAKTIVRYAFLGYSNNIYNPSTWTFEASNDNTNWTVLESISGYTISNSQWYISPIISNSTAYLYYRINVTLTSGANTPVINEIEFTESSASPYGTVAGKNAAGTFVLNAGYTLNPTYIYSSTGTATGCVQFNANSPGVATITCPNLLATQATATIYVSGTGTLNINGNIGAANQVHGSGQSILYLASGANPVVNIAGSVIGGYGWSGSTSEINVLSQGTINIIGNVTAAIASDSVLIRTQGSNAIINITGDVTGGANTSCSAFVLSNSTTLNITGNVYASANTALTNTGTINVNITGNLYATTSNYAVNLGGAAILTIVGTLYPSTVYSAFANTSTSSLSYVPGNLVNNQGIMAFYAARVVFTSISRTWTFQKANLVNKLLYTSDLVPSGSGTYPLASNVRSGISYGLGAYTGSLVMPAYQNVAFGIDVDDAKGVAFLSAASLNDIAAAVWNQLTTNISTTGSIGERLKNASTVYTTGQQLAGFDI